MLRPSRRSNGVNASALHSRYVADHARTKQRRDRHRQASPDPWPPDVLPVAGEGRSASRSAPGVLIPVERYVTRSPLSLESMAAAIRRAAPEVEDRDPVLDRTLHERPVEQHV